MLTSQTSIFNFMTRTKQPRIQQTECPDCGMIYNIDMLNLKKTTIKCYGCDKKIKLDTETISFMVVE